jgi:hypothetical protein
MAEVESIEVSYSRKVQLDQFEPVEHFVAMEIDLEEGDDRDEVYDEYAAEAEDMVERSITERVASKKLEGDDGESG